MNTISHEIRPLCNKLRNSTPRGKAAALGILAVIISTLVLAGLYAAAPTSASASAELASAAPNANAGLDRTVYIGTPARLNGSWTSGGVAPYNYTWTFIYNGSDVVLYGVAPSFRFWTVGVYTILLNVTDATSEWDMDTVIRTVLVDNQPPVAEPGNNKTVIVYHKVILNGGESTDNSGVIVNYTWSFLYNGSTVYLYGPLVYFWFNNTGHYNVTLTVTDLAGLQGTWYVQVDVGTEPTWLEANWLMLLIVGLIVALVGQWTVRKYMRDKALLTPTDRDKLKLQAKSWKKLTTVFLHTWMGVMGVLIILFFLGIVVYAKVFVPYDPSVGSSEVLVDSSWQHPFGTDQMGRDVLVRTLHGTSASLTVGFVAMALSMGLGTIVGLASGYWGGWRDEVIMRVNDVFLSIPWLVLMIVIAAIWGSQSLWSVIVVIGITGWSTTARIVRSQVLSVKARMFVERAKAIGAGEWHIIFTHILPNVVPLIFAEAILTIAISILSESTLSFLGLGPQDVETWGRILEDAYNQSAALAGPYLFIIMPGLCIVFVVLGFTFVGYAMDEVLNPKLRKR
jgi:peptide/nickel transport system permease protein